MRKVIRGAGTGLPSFHVGRMGFKNATRWQNAPSTRHVAPHPTTRRHARWRSLADQPMMPVLIGRTRSLLTPQVGRTPKNGECRGCSCLSVLCCLTPLKVKGTLILRPYAKWAPCSKNQAIIEVRDGTTESASSAMYIQSRTTMMERPLASLNDA